ncbi:MAG: hypothetical protein WAW07_16800 [Bacteroidales bacterium]
MMDFLPTLSGIIGATLPEGREIDGQNIFPLLTDKKARPHYSYLCYYGRDGNLAAIRKGEWKLHLLEPSERWAGKQPVKELTELALSVDKELTYELRPAYVE